MNDFPMRQLSPSLNPQFFVEMKQSGVQQGTISHLSVAKADLGGAAKQLTQNAFLDVIQLPDAGSYASCQLVVDVRVSTQCL